MRTAAQADRTLFSGRPRGSPDFSQGSFEWIRTAPKQSANVKRAFDERAIERLNGQAAKLRSRLDQIYLDILHGEIEESFYGIHVAAWKKEQAAFRKRIDLHESARHTYIDRGIRLLELARDAIEFSRTQGQEERAVLLRFILQGSTLQDDNVVPALIPPSEIIRELVEDPRKGDRRGTHLSDKPSRTKKQVASSEVTTCPVLLPRFDEYRTFCYEYEIGPIPDLLGVQE